MKESITLLLKAFILLFCILQITFSQETNHGFLNSQEPSEDFSHDGRVLAGHFESPYGAVQFPMIYSGDQTWVCRLPFPSTTIMRSVSLYLYSNFSWFPQNSNFQSHAISEPEDSRETQTANLLYDTIEGQTYKVAAKSKDLSWVYNFLSTENTTSLNKFTGFNGGIGLGVSKEAPSGSLPTSINLKVFHMFSLYLSKDYQMPSHILFGGMDPNYVEESSELKMIPLSTENWTVSFSGFQSQLEGGKRFGIDNEFTAAFDINTPFIGIPESSFNEIFFSSGSAFEQCEMQSDRKALVCDCKDIASVKSFGFKLEVNKLVLPASEVIENVNGECIVRVACLTTTSAKEGEDEGDCWTVNEQFADVWVLGGPFLSHFYTSFAYDWGWQSPEVIFRVAKKVLDLHEVFTNYAEAKDAKKNYEILIILGIALGGFVAAVAVFFCLKGCATLLIEKKNKYYLRHSTLQETEENREVHSQE